jgi:hypothetical protein
VSPPNLKPSSGLGVGPFLSKVRHIFRCTRILTGKCLDGNKICETTHQRQGASSEIASAINSAKHCLLEVETATFATGSIDGWQRSLNDSLSAVAQSSDWTDPESQALFKTVGVDEIRHLAYTSYSTAGTAQPLHLERGGMAITLTNHEDGARIIVVGTPKDFVTLDGMELKDVYTKVYDFMAKRSYNFAQYESSLDMSIFLLQPGESV